MDKRGFARGEVALAMLIGVVLVILVVGGFFLTQKVTTEKLEVESSEVVESSQIMLSTTLFVESCLDKTVEDGIELLSKQGGYYRPGFGAVHEGFIVPFYINNGDYSPTPLEVEFELSNYVQDHLDTCLDDFTFLSRQGFSVSDAEKNVFVTMEEDDFLVNLEYPIQIHDDEFSAELGSLSTSISSSLGKLFFLSKEILKISDESLAMSEMIDFGILHDISIKLTQRDDEVVFSLVDTAPPISESEEEIIPEGYEFVFSIKYNWQESDVHFVEPPLNVPSNGLPLVGAAGSQPVAEPIAPVTEISNFENQFVSSENPAVVAVANPDAYIAYAGGNLETFDPLIFEDVMVAHPAKMNQFRESGLLLRYFEKKDVNFYGGIRGDIASFDKATKTFTDASGTEFTTSQLKIQETQGYDLRITEEGNLGFMLRKQDGERTFTFSGGKFSEQDSELVLTGGKMISDWGEVALPEGATITFARDTKELPFDLAQPIIEGTNVQLPGGSILLNGKAAVGKDSIHYIGSQAEPTQFSTVHNTRYHVEQAVNYYTDSLPHEGNYIQEDSGFGILTVGGEGGAGSDNPITAELLPGNPFELVEVKQVKVRIIEGKSIVDVNVGITVSGPLPSVVVANDYGHYVSQDGSGKCDEVCSRVVSALTKPRGVQRIRDVFSRVPTADPFELRDLMYSFPRDDVQDNALFIFEQMQSEDPKKRSFALVLAHGLREHPQFVDRLIYSLANDPDPDNKYSATNLLSTYQGVEKRNKIFEVFWRSEKDGTRRFALQFSDDPDFLMSFADNLYFQEEAIKQLRKFNDRDDVNEFLINVAADESNSRYVRGSAISSLSPNNAFSQISTILQSSNPGLVGVIDLDIALEGVEVDNVVSQVTSLLQHDNAKVREGAVDILAHVLPNDPEKVIPVLKVAAINEQDTDVFTIIAHRIESAQFELTQVQKTHTFPVDEFASDLKSRLATEDVESKLQLAKLFSSFEQTANLQNTREDAARAQSEVRLAYLEGLGTYSPEKLQEIRTTLNSMDNEDYGSKDIPFMASLRAEELQVSPERLAAVQNRIDSLEHVHRDTRFTNYEQTESLAELTSMEVVKVEKLLDYFGKSDNVNTIIEIMGRDIDDTTTEYGGLVQHRDGKLQFTEVPPKWGFRNGAYIPPPESVVESRASFADFHFHATVEHDHVFAGPSRDNGDLGVAKSSNVDGVVITSLGRNCFNVDYYTPNRVVKDVGKYCK